MTKTERIEAIKWNIQECESKIIDLNRQRGQFTSFNGEEFEGTWEYDKYVIDTQIKDLEREIQSDLNRIATLEREVEAYYFLEGLQAKIEDILKDIDYYKEK